MSDIVERLLACHGIICNDPECNCAEAADEIKRLRAALEQITKASWYGKNSMIEIARRALERK